ncbi:MAG: LPP20 family lipoprotein [Candidatus Marinimicrobia bacterium]|nr:LPP20 family lipoprotein [Candidatus Neomarinimicrobiota bacterium]
MTQKIKILNSIIILIGAILLLASCAGKKAPIWYTDLPAGADYYHGIGIVEKTAENTGELRQIAKNAALDDIASQIRVNIQSEMKTAYTESAAGVDEQVEFIAQSRTQAVLTGVEQVEIFENKTSYGIYMRLSKAAYEQESKKIYQLGISEARNYLDLAQADDAQPLQILQNKLYALNKLSAIEDLITRYDKLGTDAKTIANIRSSLAEWFSQLQLSTAMDQANWVIPKGLRKPIMVQITQKRCEERVSLKRFPLQVTFADTTFKVQANDDGVVTLETIHFEFVNASGLITIEPDITELVGDQGEVMPFLKTIQLPKIQLNLEVSGPLVELRANETALDKPMKHPYISPILKAQLQETVAAEFVDGFSQSSVDFVITIDATSAKAGPASEAYGKTIYKCLSSVEINVMDALGEETLFTTHLQDVDGAAFKGFEAASQKSYDKLAKKFEAEVVPEIIQVFKGN